jgi:hypothetical protein
VKILSSRQLEGRAVGILNAGALTTDMTIYSLDSSPRRIVELALPLRILEGSSSVTSRVRAYLVEKLRGTRFDSRLNIRNMVKDFNDSTLPNFKDANEPSYIKFGTSSDNDIVMGIRAGHLEIPGSQMAEFLEPSVQAIATCIHHQQKAAGKPIAVKFALFYPTDLT